MTARARISFRGSRAATAALIAIFCSLVALSGCSIVKLKQEADAFYASTVLVGRVEGPPGWRGPVIVAAYERTSAGPIIAHRTLLHEAGSYELIVPKGEYRIAAFGDSNGNHIQDDDEPFGEYAAPAITSTGSGVVAGLDFRLSPSPPRSLTLFANAPPTSPLTWHSTQAGAIAKLDAPAFSAEMGRAGYWRPMEFFQQAGGNIYFLEPYDPKRIPILFIHGAAGSPQDWRYFFEHLDHSRYQAWFFYYPSGSSVDSMSHLLYWKLLNLQMRYRFETMYVTAHSMGGLVARSFLLDYGSQFPQVKMFLSLSTPWAGEEAAELGVKHSPAVVPSWHDMQPRGTFMQELFTRRLPATMDYYLFFGYRGTGVLRPNSDGTVTLASQLRSAAQQESRMVMGFDEDHVSILSSPQVFAHYQRVLTDLEQRSDGRAPSGQLQIHVALDGNAGSPTGIPVLLLRPAGDAARGQPPIVVPLTLDGGSRVVRPLPAGEYEASLIVPSYKTKPHKTRIRIDADAATDSAARLDFQLMPRGQLDGYIGRDQDPPQNAAGSYRPPHENVRIRSITLTGANTRRSLAPRQSGSEDVVAYFAADEDFAYKSYFSFVDLPADDYELTIVAEGYQPHTSRHRIVPGQQSQIAPVVLKRERP